MNISANNLVIRTIKRWNFTVESRDMYSLNLCSIARYFAVALIVATVALGWIILAMAGALMECTLMVQGLDSIIVAEAKVASEIPLILVTLSVVSTLTLGTIVSAGVFVILVTVGHYHKQYKRRKAQCLDDCQSEPNLLWEYIKSVHGKYCVPVKLVDD